MCSVSVYVCTCTLLQEGRHAVRVISCLYMVPSIFGHCGEGERYIEGLNKTKKIERKGRRGGRREKQDDNKSSSDFTDAYFINHVNKSW